MVPVVAVASTEPGYLAVGAIEDHVLVYPVHPGKHWFARVGLHLEVVRASICARQGTEPHHRPTIVEDHRAALPSVAFLWSDEDVAWGCAVHLRAHLDDRRAEVRARAEGPYALRRRGWSAWQGPNLWGGQG